MAPDAIINLVICEHRPAHDPGSHGPAGQGCTVPGRPLALRQLLLVQDSTGPVQIDQNQVGIEALTDCSFVPDVPDTSRGFTHPGNDLVQPTAAMSDLVQHKSQ